MSFCIDVPHHPPSSPSQNSSLSSPSSSSARPSPDTAPLRRRRPPRSEILQYISDSAPHAFLIEHFRKEEEAYSSLVDSDEDNWRTRIHEMYQLLVMFAVFQGVIFVAVSQSTVLSYKDAWSPFSLSLTACVATVLAVKQKRHTMDDLEQKIRRNKDRANAICGKIEEMKLKGAEFDFGEVHTRPSAASDEGLHRAFSVSGNMILATIFIFSASIIASCLIVLRRECPC